jgi:hypothetical protein
VGAFKNRQKRDFRPKIQQQEPKSKGCDWSVGQPVTQRSTTQLTMTARVSLVSKHALECLHLAQFNGEPCRMNLA